MNIQKVTPFLWFDNQAAEAAAFYVSVFPNAKIISSNPMVTQFELEGLQIMALNGGPKFKLDEAFSFSISCENQEEIDYFWDKLTGDGGQESMCGWLKDKFGLSWQVVPAQLGELMSEPDRANRVVKAFLQMRKMDIAALVNA